MNQKNKIKIVNAITLSRIIGTALLPLIISLFSPLGVAVYIGTLWTTDLLDGRLARHWDVSTILGSILDAVSDKLFGISALIYLSTFFPIVKISVVLELLTALTNASFLFLGSDVKSSKIGKVKTVILAIVTALSVLSTVSISNLLTLIIPYLIGVTAITESIALIDYIDKNVKYLKENNYKKKKKKNKMKSWEQIKEDLISPDYHKKHIDEPLLDKFRENNTAILKQKKFSEENKNILKSMSLSDDEIAKIELFALTNNVSFDSIINKLKEYIQEVSLTKDSFDNLFEKLNSNIFTYQQQQALKVIYNINDKDVENLQGFIIETNISFKELIDLLNNYLSENDQVLESNKSTKLLKNKSKTKQ